MRIAAGDIYRLTLMDGAGKHSTTVVTGNHPYVLAANENGAGGLLVAANDNGMADPTVLRIEPGGDWQIVKNLMPGDRVRTVLNGALTDGVNRPRHRPRTPHRRLAPTGPDPAPRL
jgi:hypothetical protein